MLETFYFSLVLLSCQPCACSHLKALLKLLRIFWNKDLDDVNLEYINDIFLADLCSSSSLFLLAVISVKPEVLQLLWMDVNLNGTW